MSFNVVDWKLLSSAFGINEDDSLQEIESLGRIETELEIALDLVRRTYSFVAHRERKAARDAMPDGLHTNYNTGERCDCLLGKKGLCYIDPESEPVTGGSDPSNGS